MPLHEPVPTKLRVLNTMQCLTHSTKTSFEQSKSFYLFHDKVFYFYHHVLLCILLSEYFVLQGNTLAPSVPSMQMLKPATGWRKITASERAVVIFANNQKPCFALIPIITGLYHDCSLCSPDESAFWPHSSSTLIFLNFDCFVLEINIHHTKSKAKIEQIYLYAR